MIATIADDLSTVGVFLILAAIVFEPTWRRWFIEAGLLAMALGAGLHGRWVMAALCLAGMASPLAVAAWVAWRARPRS
jgi:hypothetical protein